MSVPPCTQRLVFKEVDGHSIHLEVWLPEKRAGPAPAYIWIHGGGFFDGCASDCSPMNILPVLERGWAFISLEYRLAPQVKLEQIVADVVDGCEFVQSGKLDEELGGGKVDGGKLCVGGASAGGMLGLVAGFSLETPPQVVSVTYPAADITHESYYKPVAFPAHIERASVEEHIRPDGPIVSHAPANVNFATMVALDRTRACFFAVQEGKVLDWATSASGPEDPALHAFVPWRLASKATPPTVIVHGDADPMVPLSRSEHLVEVLKEKGVEAKLIVLEGEGHGFDLVPGAMEDGKKVGATEQANDFVAKYLA